MGGQEERGGLRDGGASTKAAKRKKCALNSPLRGRKKRALRAGNEEKAIPAISCGDGKKFPLFSFLSRGKKRGRSLV